MKKILLLLPLIFLLGCSGSEKNARDAIAASKGAINTAQAKYHDSCVADSTQHSCIVINKGIDAYNSTINALRLYCSGTPKEGDQPFMLSADGSSGGGPCVVDKSVQPKLDGAVASLNQILGDVKGLAQ